MSSVIAAHRPNFRPSVQTYSRQVCPYSASQPDVMTTFAVSASLTFLILSLFKVEINQGWCVASAGQ